MDKLRRVGRWFAPKAEKNEAGRDQWGSRTSFVLAAMGGAVGLGNLLRYPGQVFHNNGIQWFIPYIMALVLLGVPILMLEICIGQAYAGGCLIAFDHINKRTKGVGMAVVFNGYAICCYYVPILAWVMQFFRHSFRNPLPWVGRGEEFYYGDVIRNPDPIEGGTYLSYPASGMLGETVGWCAFTWFIVWLCMFKGVGMLGRVVYFTMGMPVVMAIILIGRGVSLPNAGRGIKLYFGEWNGSQLGQGQIWQAACGQIFFSIGGA
jgi:solute carrier family 6 (neurotransmitter transporter, GABA) member 1